MEKIVHCSPISVLPFAICKEPHILIKVLKAIIIEKIDRMGAPSIKSEPNIIFIIEGEFADNKKNKGIDKIATFFDNCKYPRYRLLESRFKSAKYGAKTLLNTGTIKL